MRALDAFLLVNTGAAPQLVKPIPLVYWWIKSSSLVIGHHVLIGWYKRPMVTCNHHSKRVTFTIPFCALFSQMASASAMNLSIRRSKSNANAINNNDQQQHSLRQLRKGNFRSVSLFHLAPLKALHAHELRPSTKSTSSAASL